MASTATLRTRIRALDEQLSGAQEQDRQSEIVGHLRKRLGQLRGALERATHAYAVIDLIEAEDVEVDEPDIPGLLSDALSDAKGAADGDPLAAGKGSSPALTMLLSSHADLVVNGARLAAARWRGKHAPPEVDEDLLLATEGRDGPLRAQCVGATEEIAMLRNVKLPTRDHLQRWTAAVGTLREIQQVVAEAAPSPPVVAFLKAVQEPPGASLELLLEDEVVEYLRDQARLDRYRVIPHRPR